MRVRIGQRFKPFSHLPGTRCLVPGTPFQVTAYPTRIAVHECAAYPKLLFLLDLVVEGPVEGFTLIQDLERGEVRVFGTAEQGYFRLALRLEGKQVVIGVQRAPRAGLSIVASALAPGVCLATRDGKPFEAGALVGKSALIASGLDLWEEGKLSDERLSLGKNKEQAWEKSAQRCDMAELFPFWLRLGQSVPSVADRLGSTAVPGLVKQCGEACARSDAAVLEGFRRLYMAGFAGILCPRLEDEEFLGLCGALAPEDRCSPLVLLRQSAALIRSLFVQSQGDTLTLLPLLPHAFPAGRMTGIRWQPFAAVDVEWRKGVVKRAQLHAHSSGLVRVQTGPRPATFRLRQSSGERGLRVQSGEPFEIVEGRSYWIDRVRR